MTCHIQRACVYVLCMRAQTKTYTCIPVCIYTQFLHYILVVHVGTSFKPHAAPLGVSAFFFIVFVIAQS